MDLSYEVRFLWGWNVSDCAHDMTVWIADTFKEYGLDCIYEPFQGDWMFVGHEFPDSRFDVEREAPDVFNIYPVSDLMVEETFKKKGKLCQENPELRKYFSNPNFYIIPYVHWKAVTE
jgi:hypothetical protein